MKLMHEPNRSTESIRVLYVDPDRAAITSLIAVLEDHSMAVTTVSSVDEGIAHLEESPVDCIVSEAELPDSSGVELFERVRTRDPELPCLIVAETASPEVVAEGCAAGVTDYLRKGVDHEHDQWIATRIVDVVADRLTDGAGPPGPSSGRLAGGSCLLDEAFRVLDVSESFASIHGYEPEELIGRPLTDVYPYVGDQHRRENRSTVLRRGARVTEETIGVHADGRPLTVGRSFVELGRDRYVCGIQYGTSTEPPRSNLRQLLRQQETLTDLCSRAREGVEPETLIEEATRRVADVLGADYCGFFESVPDTGEIALRSGVGWDRAVEPSVDRSDARSHVGFTLCANEPVYFRDLRAEDRFDGSAPLVDHDVVSGIGVAVGTDRGPRGVLSVYSTAERGYTTVELEFVQSVAHVLSLRFEDDRRRLEFGLVSELAGELSESETRSDLCERVVEAVESVPELAVTVIYLFDEPDDLLRPRAWTPRADDHLADVPFDENDTGPVWEAFFDRRATLVAELSPEPSGPVDEPSNAGGVVLPLGRHGVLVAGPSDPDRSIGSALPAIQTVASLTRMGLTHVASIRRIDAYESAETTQRRTIDRLTTVTDTTRDVDRAIANLNSRDELERTICERLAEWDAIAFVWIGEYDEISKRIEPRIAAGADDGFLNSISIDLQASLEEQEPMGMAVRQREAQSRPRLVSDVSAERWRREALKRGFRSVVSVPIVYRDFRYGGVSAYSDRPDAFTTTERECLEDIGTRIGQALNVIDLRGALIGSGVVELEFRLDAAQVPFVEWTELTDCRFELEAVVSRVDGSIRGFFTIEHESPDRVLELASRSSGMTDTRLVTERGAKHLFECTLTESSLLTTALEYGAVPKTMAANDGNGCLVVELPEDANVREFVTVFQRSYPDAELVRHRQRERTLQTRYGFLAEVEAHLTERQQEVLRTAYASGYFQTPRESTGKDVAELLEISQPTFNHHLRAAQRKLLSMLFTETEAEGCRSIGDD